MLPTSTLTIRRPGKQPSALPGYSSRLIDTAGAPNVYNWETLPCVDEVPWNEGGSEFPDHRVSNGSHTTGNHQRRLPSANIRNIRRAQCIRRCFSTRDSKASMNFQM